MNNINMYRYIKINSYIYTYICTYIYALLVNKATVAGRYRNGFTSICVRGPKHKFIYIKDVRSTNLWTRRF
jgi:hypothetical protein